MKRFLYLEESVIYFIANNFKNLSFHRYLCVTCATFLLPICNVLTMVVYDIQWPCCCCCYSLFSNEDIEHHEKFIVCKLIFYLNKVFLNISQNRLWKSSYEVFISFKYWSIQNVQFVYFTSVLHMYTFSILHTLLKKSPVHFLIIVYNFSNFFLSHQDHLTIRREVYIFMVY